MCLSLMRSHVVCFVIGYRICFRSLSLLSWLPHNRRASRILEKLEDERSTAVSMVDVVETQYPPHRIIYHLPPSSLFTLPFCVL